ncbi:MAG: hypothetical protein JWN73_2580 [Betaproteobacteria bacterium]|nr:hypothetical protein [Betaproteobacteria bacterium]
MHIVMNSPPASFEFATPPRRVLLAVVLSLAAHVLLVGGAVMEWGNPFSSPPAEEPVVVKAHLLPPPPPPPVPREVLPEPPIRPAPIHRPATPRPQARSAAPVLSSPPGDQPVASGDVLAGDTATGTGNAPVVASAAPQAPVAAPVPPKASPLPGRAHIEFDLLMEGKNFRAYVAQEWRMQDGRYSVSMAGRVLFFRVAFDSSGAVTGATLRPERYSDDRNGRVNAIDFASDPKNAQVSEASGNHKSVALAGPVADLMSLPYALALNPEMPVGTLLMMANKENVEQVRLVERRDEVLTTERFTVNTRFFDFRRAEGEGGVQVWLAPEQHWLPAKLRVAGRDGPVTFTATRYEFDAAQ